MDFYSYCFHSHVSSVLTPQHPKEQENILRSSTVQHAHAAVMRYCGQWASVMCPPAYKISGSLLQAWITTWFKLVKLMKHLLWCDVRNFTRQQIIFNFTIKHDVFNRLERLLHDLICLRYACTTRKWQLAVEGGLFKLSSLFDSLLLSSPIKLNWCATTEQRKLFKW